MTKLKMLALALFVAGLCASYALAGNGHGHGNGTATSGKVTLCHKAGKSGRYVKITVAAKGATARLKHGDVAPNADGSCPAPAAPTTTAAETTTTTP